MESVKNIQLTNQENSQAEWWLDQQLLTELAMYYPKTSFGGDLVKYHHMSIDDLKDFLIDPEKYKTLFNLDDYDIDDVKIWIHQTIDEEKSKVAKYQSLKEKYPNNTLFKETLSGFPENFESVYHFTSEKYLDAISREGLKPTIKVFETTQNQDEVAFRDEAYAIDQVFDKYAPQGFTRTGAVYAFEDFHKPSLSKGNIVLEIKVDPKKVLIAEGELKTEAVMRHGYGHDFDHLAEKYWKTAMSLDAFKKLPLDQQINMFFVPEVVIPNEVAGHCMRVHSVR